MAKNNTQKEPTSMITAKIPFKLKRMLKIKAAENDIMMTTIVTELLKKYVSGQIVIKKEK